MNSKFLFVKEALKNYKTSGTIVPSSRFLANKMLKDINFTNANLIVELGPGNGAFTREILKKLKPNTTFICFEINDVFYNELSLIKHAQLKVIKASAEFMEIELLKEGFTSADYIISSIPLSILPKKISNGILKEAFKVLKKGGSFIQFQYTLSYYKQLKNIFFKENITLSFEAVNFPPAFIYYCNKE